MDVPLESIDVALLREIERVCTIKDQMKVLCPAYVDIGDSLISQDIDAAMEALTYGDGEQKRKMYDAMRHYEEPHLAPVEE